MNILEEKLVKDFIFQFILSKQIGNYSQTIQARAKQMH